VLSGSYIGLLKFLKDVKWVYKFCGGAGRKWEVQEVMS